MKKPTNWMVEKFIKNHQNINDLEVRSRYGALEGWLSIVINVVLFVIKITAGLIINSVSLIADAIHTLADLATSVVVILGFKMAKKPSDKEHPFGHGRMESVATLVVSVLLFVAAVELMEKSVHSIIKPETSTASVGIIILIIATIVIKELLSRFSYILGEMIDSQALKADALHHRSDVIATALVVVALIASRFGFHNVDGIMGVGVSLIIGYSAYSITKGAIDPLLGAAPSKEDIRKVEKLAKKYPDVLGVHDIIINKYGQTNIISMHIEVSDKESVVTLHDLSEDIEADIVQMMGGMAIVHVDPINRDHPQYDAIAQAIKEIIDADTRVHSFHELRIVGCKQDRCNVVFDISLDLNVDEQETCVIIRSIREKFKFKFPQMKTVIKAEPKYVYNI